MSLPLKSTPLVAPGHTRPVTHLAFSPIQDDGSFLLVSSCKDGNPMLREWTGDWIGTFLGHKGAVWSTKLSPDAAKAVSGSADFTAWVFRFFSFFSSSNVSLLTYKLPEKYGIHIRVLYCTLSRTITSSAPSQSHLRHPESSRVVRKRRLGYSISIGLTPTQISWWKTVPSLTMVW